MRELRSYGSVRGAAGNGRPYRERVKAGPHGFTQLYRRWRKALRVRQSGADPKPPQAAAVKSRGGERCGNAGTMILAGKVERGERKRTADEVSKAD